tara:strand:- start:669 stop:887 length:219 start_codon:yes stop_codon:yes gene_type:complete
MTIKENFMQLHLYFINEYIEAHPEVTWDQAYRMDELSDKAYKKLNDQYSNPMEIPIDDDDNTDQLNLIQDFE